MASQENAELDRTNTGTGDDTIVAARKKRLRRVSFADVEITSIHIFKRDEDFSDSTPPCDPKPDEETGKLPGGDGVVLFRDLGDHSDDFKERSCDREDEKEDGSEEDVGGRAPFFRPLEWPSPGSSTVGSAVSNDEDNFFGPVQSDFIRPGRLSDSAFSDENHDITMDSTAFSMHYRSLARSESEGDVKTPTRMGLRFTEKTPTQDGTDTNQGSLMVLTNAGKMTLESSFPCDDAGSGGKDLNEMSLVREEPDRYDYGRLSPTLDALLAEGSMDLHCASLSHLSDHKSSSTFDENAIGQRDLIGFGDEEIGRSVRDTNMVIAAACVDAQEANYYSGIMPHHVMKDVSNRNDWSADAFESINTPEQPINGNKLIENKAEVDGLNTEFSITRVTRWSNGGKFPDLDISSLHGSTYGGSSQEILKENFPRNESESIVKSGRMTESPLAGSISSISAKRREIFSHAATSPANFLNSTPLPVQSASSSSKESLKRGLDLSAIQKSISKFRTLDTSPMMPSLKNGIETLKIKISNYLTANSPQNVSPVESSIDIQSKGARALSAHLESPSDDPKSADCKRMAFVDSNGIPNPHIIKKVPLLGQNQGVVLAMESRKPLDDPYSSTSSQNKPARDVILMTLSPKKFSSSGPISSDFPKRVLHASEVGSPMVNVALHHRRDNGDACVPSKLLVSPVEEVNQNSSTVEYYQKGVSGELNQQNHFNKFIGIISEENQTSRGMMTSVGYLTPKPDKLKSVSFMEGDNQKSSAIKYYQGGSDAELTQQHQLSKFSGINSEENLTSLEIVNSGGSPNPDRLQSFSSRTKARDGDDLDLLPVSTLKELPSVNDGADFRKDVPSLVRNAPSVSTSVGSHGRTDGSSFKKSPLKKPEEIPMRVKSTQSPCLGELPNSLPAHNMQILPGEEIASTPSKLICVQNEFCQSEGPFPVDDKESISRKRRSEEVVLGHEYHTAKVAKTRSLEVEKSESHGFAGHLESSNENEKHGLIMPPRDWKDVLTKFSQDTENMLSPLRDRLDLRGINMLEETMDNLQKVRNYDILSSEIQSKLNNASNKRSAETLMLLQKLMYEKVRLQLNLEQRDRLQKIAKKLSSGTEESQKLRRIYKESVSLPVEKGNQLDCHLCSANDKLKKAANDNVIVLRQEGDVLDERVRSLSNSLLTYCKTRGQQDCISDIASLDESLKKRMYHRLVHQHLQPWEVAAFESSNSHHNISLNYLGFVHQSISVMRDPVPSLTVSNQLQDVKINKTFPNMDACVAFAYVFSGEATEKLESSRSLAQKTQATNSLLRNLLEVVEEVQQARLEIKNLTCTTFQSPSGRQLNLLLSFIDVNSVQKVTITLDMMGLNRGIYPSKVLPDHVEVFTNGMPQSLATEVRAAASHVPFGYQRIMRLCRCISKTLQGSSN